ncbi:hypothetical protein LZ554_003458 [Drepanopeziza brunnea f. sp. 'monogermtubi']|nr:hypothetical protein LZ554_003458 [Drepanopeziza brunnea f. sp. 'monogermtubi']
MGILGMLTPHYYHSPYSDATANQPFPGSAAEATPQPQQRVDFLYGDVRIKIRMGGMIYEGKVVRQALVLASPVWDRLLRAKPGDPPVKSIDFQEDDGEALFIFLCIAHLVFDLVPSKLREAALYNVVLLAEKYECFHLVKPWIPKWLKVYESTMSGLTHISLPSLQHKLFIAWTLGQEAVFRQIAQILTKEMAHETHLTDRDPVSGRKTVFLCANNGHVDRLEEKLLPADLFESMCSVRDRSLQYLLDLPHSELARRSQSVPGSYCLHGKPNCDIHIYSNMTKELKRWGLWFLKSTMDVDFSVLQVAIFIGTMRPAYPFPTPADPFDHADCGPNFLKPVTLMLENFPDPSLECQIEHMAMRNRYLFPDDCKDLFLEQWQGRYEDF